jgi:hypothetical protein
MVAGGNGYLEHQIFHGVVGNGLADGVCIGARLQSQIDACAGFGGEHIPALRLAAQLAGGLGECVIGMHLDGELVVRKEDLEQQRVVREGGREFAEDFLAMRGDKRAERLACCRPCRNGAGVARQPGFADRLGWLERVPGRKIERAPGTGAEPGFEKKGREELFGHALSILWVSRWSKAISSATGPTTGKIGLFRFNNKGTCAISGRSGRSCA